MVTACPAIVTVPLRAAPVFAATVTAIVPVRLVPELGGTTIHGV